MPRSRALCRSIPLALLLVCGACAEPPNKELDQAQGAIETARAAGADEFAPEEIRAAADALARAHIAVGQRDYRQALSLALDAKERAREAARTAVERMAQRRSEAGEAINAAERALATAQQRLSPADGPRPPASQHAALTAGLKAASRNLQEARTAFEKQQYPKAKSSADAALTRIRETMTTLSDAQARSRRSVARRP
jgi:tetratricopeptide (TPR) repeat protein